MQPLIIITGPTGVGKSAAAVTLAEQIHGEIISGDSVQMYRSLDIGSAKPSVEERRGVPHHLIDCLDPDEPYTAARFQQEAQRWIEEIRQRGHVPIVAGGSGLYVRALLDPFRFAPAGSEEVRLKWRAYVRQQGNQALHQALAACDPASAARLHPNDTCRMIRALEVFELTGRPLSQAREFKEKEYPPVPENVVYLGLNTERSELYRRIDERCVRMIEQGLLAETLGILRAGYARNLKPLQSIGYRQALWQLYGLVTEREMLRLMQRDTRHLAKRQLTWFQRDPRIRWFDPLAGGVEEMLRLCLLRLD
ncbi:MAG: tRNA (adenosine(37)-N6)-dimethylallyltransferase MiaA [Peptococcaceae bacterium]|jgi:tRNA dimethylallyltransferase|nr:tRNA (adenosine(37)-N6)-dimethylallyltransferase MiaA [Peptococcaceae bacterium]